MKETLRKKRIRTICLAVLAAALIVYFAVYYLMDDGQEGTVTVSIEIQCDLTGKTILPMTRMQCSRGETVYDALASICREKDIQMEASGMESRYVEGIDHIYEFDDGPESGWMFQINGEYMKKSCSSCEVKDGDVITWTYAKSLGEYD